MRLKLKTELVMSIVMETVNDAFERSVEMWRHVEIWENREINRMIKHKIKTEKDQDGTRKRKRDSDCNCKDSERKRTRLDNIQNNDEPTYVVEKEEVVTSVLIKSLSNLKIGPESPSLHKVNSIQTYQNITKVLYKNWVKTETLNDLVMGPNFKNYFDTFPNYKLQSKEVKTFKRLDLKSNTNKNGLSLSESNKNSGGNDVKRKVKNFNDDSNIVID